MSNEKELAILTEHDGVGYYGTDNEGKKDEMVMKKIEKMNSSWLERIGCLCTPCIGVANFVAFLFQACCLVLVFILVLVFGIVLIAEIRSNSSEENNDDTIITKTYSLLEDISYAVGYQLKPSSSPPTLIVQITIDQFRSDEIMKFRKRFIPNGGFDRMFRSGVFYRNGRYRNGRTVTPVGHATLLTGGVGFSHGIVAHSFLDPNLGKIVSSTENRNFSEPTGLENITNTAPSYLVSSTTGDELRLFTNKSKVFSISGKDYVAIIQAGHLGKGFWFSTNTGRFITSTYFYPNEADLPPYVTEWNDKKIADSYEDKYWELTYPQKLYHFQNRDYIHPGWNLGKTFPKPLYNSDKVDYYKTLIQTPIEDKIMWDFVKTVIENERLGKRKDEEREDGDIIDMLAMSFSTLDKVGHANGPNSLEYEDTVYKLDELMKNILDYLDLYLGLENCLIVLSSDHGVDLAWRKSYDLKYSTAGILETDDVTPLLEQYLNETVFDNQLTSPVVFDFVKANLYFNKDVIRSHGKTVDEVSETAAQWLEEEIDTIFFAFTKKQIREGRVPDTMIGKSAMLTYFPKHSGDIVVFVNEHVFLTKDFDAGAATHGTPWSYDASVPILFMGKDVPEGLVIDRKVTPEDVAPTIAKYYGINTPSGSVGNPLIEVLKNHDINPYEN